MSARQRHSRVSTDDGWTTISSSHKKSRKSKANAGATSGSSAAKKGPDYLSAILAHKSDLEFGSSDSVGAGDDKAAEEVTEEELEKAKKTLERQIDKFNESSCCQKLKDLFRGKLGVSNSDLAKDIPESKRQDAGVIDHILLLALGEISSTFKPAPGYQLAAGLAIVELLLEYQSHASCSTINEEQGTTPDSLQILSYDPVYTPLDQRLLEDHGVSAITASSIPALPSPSTEDESTPPQLSSSWYTSSLIYMPHASIWLNHRYLMTKPKVWIGNTFDVYERAVMDGLDEQRSKGKFEAEEGSEIAVMIKDIQKVIKDFDYERLEWPEVEWGGGVIFNSTVIYIRRRDVLAVEDTLDESLAEEVKKIEIN